MQQELYSWNMLARVLSTLPWCWLARYICVNNERVILPSTSLPWRHSIYT